MIIVTFYIDAPYGNWIGLGVLAYAGVTDFFDGYVARAMSQQSALGKFLDGWEKALQWTDFEYLVNKWQSLVKSDLDKDRLGVFWALLFLSSENRIEIKQTNSLYGPIQIKRIIPDGALAQLPIENLEVEDTSSNAA